MHVLRAVGKVEEQETVPSGKLHDGINSRIVMTIPRGRINEDEPRVFSFPYHIFEIPQLQGVCLQLFFGIFLVQLPFVPDPERIQLAVDGQEAPVHVVNGMQVVEQNLMEPRVVAVEHTQHPVPFAWVYLVELPSDNLVIVMPLQPAQMLRVVTLKDIVGGRHLVDDEARMMAPPYHLPPRMIKDNPLSVLPAVVARKAEGVRNQRGIVVMDGAGGTEHEYVVRRSVDDVVLVAEIAARCVVRHIGEQSAEPPVQQDGKQEEQARLE